MNRTADLTHYSRGLGLSGGSHGKSGVTRRRMPPMPQDGGQKRPGKGKK